MSLVDIYPPLHPGCRCKLVEFGDFGGGGAEKGTGAGKKVTSFDDFGRYFVRGFKDFFGAQWEAVKQIVGDPFGTYISYMQDIYGDLTALIPGKILADTVTIPSLKEVAGFWEDIIAGDLRGVAEFFGRGAARAIESAVFAAIAKGASSITGRLPGTVPGGDVVDDVADDVLDDVADDVADGAGKEAKGLIGTEFEDYLNKQIGGDGSFSVGGRQFDGGIGNRWWEAKSGEYWNMLNNNARELANFKSSMGERLRIAIDNGATYELISNTPIPHYVKVWLDAKGIPYTEILG